jgi:hypothetical protein
MIEWLGKFADQAPQTALVLGGLYLAVRQITADLAVIKRRMDCFETSQHACQLANAKDFATKTELGKTWDRIDDHESRISRIEGKG